MPYFNHAGARLFYEETGQGSPLLLLHGASLDSAQWAHQVERFAPCYRVITLDARGHGKSSLPAGAVDSALFWQDVVALLDCLNIERCVICGLSMGGHVALQTAIHAPGRVAALILMGTPCTNRFNLFERVCVPVNRISLRLMPMGALAWCLAITLGGAAETRDYLKRTVGALNHDAFHRVWRAVTTMESRNDLGRVACPTLILIGDRDVLTARQQPTLHAAIKGSRLVTIPNAHHATNLDNPQQVEEEMERFLLEIYS